MMQDADGTPTFESWIESANIALASGDKASAHRSLLAAIQSISERADMRRELVGALVRLGTVEMDMGNIAAARGTFREAVAVAEATCGPDSLEVVPALKGLAAACVAAGASADARPLVSRAIEICDRNPGAEEGALASLLNELSRLYFRQGAHEDAERLLQRLLGIKRHKGDDHPEVATVTASLAAVRQALGRYDSAEQLWRRVLEIRERTLAPSHFSLATTLEHLSDTCAARGKLAEALQYAKRALVIRELALGTEHASVRALRERIGDLQLQGDEDSLEAPVPMRPVAPRPSPMAPPPPAAARDSSPFRVPILIPPDPAPAMPTPPVPAVAAVPATPPAAPTSSALVPAAEVDVHAVLRDLQHDIEVSEPPARPAMLALLRGFPAALMARRPAAIATAGAVVLLFGGAGAFAVVQARPKQVWVFDETARQQGRPGPASAAPVLPSVPAPVRDSVLPEKPAAGASPRRGAAEERERPGRVETSARPRTPEPAAEEPIKPIGRAVMPRLDSVVGAIAVTRANLGDAQMQRSLADVGKDMTPESPSADRMGTRARLIGALPTPQYPQTLNWASVGGQVRVRFEVDTSGRPVMSTFQPIGSPNPGLVNAVRQVIPGMRFEPARSPWPEARAMVDQVELAFQFTPKGRR